MRRLIAFAVILGFYVYLALPIVERLGHELDQASLCTATAIAAATGFTWFLVNGWWTAATRPYRPQRVTLETQETPYGIGCRAVLAVVALIVTVAAMVFVALVVRSGWL